MNGVLKRSSQLALALTLALAMQMAGASLASAEAVIIPIGPEQVREKFEEGHAALLGRSLLPPELQAELSDAIDGMSFQPEMLIELDADDAAVLAASAPSLDLLEVPVAAEAKRFVASTPDQAMVLDVTHAPGVAVAALHLVPTLDGQGIGQDAAIKTTVTQVLDSLTVTTQYGTSSSTETYDTSSAAVTCSGSCVLGGLAIGAVALACAGPQAILCGAAFLIGGTSAGLICNAECVQRAPGAYMGQTNYCEGVGCGIRGTLAIASSISYSSSSVIARFDWPGGRSQWNTHTWNIEMSTNQGGIRAYSLIGYVGDNGANASVCGSVSVAVSAYVRLSNGHTMPAYFGSAKPPTPC